MISTKCNTKHRYKVLVVLYEVRRAKHFKVALLQSSVCQSGTNVLYANPDIINQLDFEKTITEHKLNKNKNQTHT